MRKLDYCMVDPSNCSATGLCMAASAGVASPAPLPALLFGLFPSLPPLVSSLFTKAFTSPRRSHSFFAVFRRRSHSFKQPHSFPRAVLVAELIFCLLSHSNTHNRYLRNRIDEKLGKCRLSASSRSSRAWPRPQWLAPLVTSTSGGRAPRPPTVLRRRTVLLRHTL